MEFIDNWYKTVKEVIFQPREFFKKMPTSGGYGEPLKFALTNIFIASLLGAVFLRFIDYFSAVLLIHGVQSGSMVWLSALLRICIMYMDIGTTFLTLLITDIFPGPGPHFSYDMIGFTIVVILGNIFILPAIYHLFLKPLGAKKNYEATFRIKAYLSVFYLLSWIPIINIFVLLYFFYATAIAFKEVHEISMKHAIVPVVLIIIILSAILLGSYLWIMRLQEEIMLKAG